MSSASQPFQLSSTQTALALLLPEHLKPEVESLRKAHDRAFGRWEPHINVVYPFVEPSQLASATDTLRGVLAEQAKIKLRTRGVGTFTHQRNATVFFKPDPESEQAVCELRKAIVRSLGCREADGTRDGTYRPHLTIGQAKVLGNSTEHLVRKADRLAHLDWEGGKLAVLKREASGRMAVVGELALGSGGDEADEHDSRVASSPAWTPCSSYAAGEGWVQGSDIASDNISRGAAASKIQVLTYNILADPEAPSIESRLPCILKSIASIVQSTSPLRVLCLQEVSEEALPLILDDSFIQTTFPFSTHQPSTFLPSYRNLVTLASLPFNFHTLQLREQHKSALIVSFPHMLLSIANVHLTSALTDRAVEIKAHQMRVVSDFLEQNSPQKELIMAGDFNLTTSSRTVESAVSGNLISEDTVKLLSTVINCDSWDDTFTLTRRATEGDVEEEYEGESGATFDRFANPLAALSISPVESGPERYDRVLIRKTGSLRPQSVDIFGRPDDRGVCGSDHYGICVTFQTSNTPILEPSASGTAPLDRGSLIEVVEDSTCLEPLIRPFLPSEDDREQRRAAIESLKGVLDDGLGDASLIFAPIGSYLMGTYFPESDVDLLTIGTYPPDVFFEFATARLNELRERGGDGLTKAHVVNSLVSILEIWVLGIKFDMQYCQSAALVRRYNSNPRPDLHKLIFHAELISSLPPASLRPLNTLRDTVYLLDSTPDHAAYQTAYRYLALYLKRQGLYSAKFGYLGGIHLSLMLNRILKLAAARTSNRAAPGAEHLSPAAIIRTFFAYYASFDWAADSVTDPALKSHEQVARAPRDALLICSIHVPTARRNVAASCNYLTGRTLTSEFARAAERLRQGDWAWCLRPQGDNIRDFFDGSGAFIRIQLDTWSEEEDGSGRDREMIGGLESRFPRLLESLGQVSGLRGRVWPAKFRPGGSAVEGVAGLKIDDGGTESRVFYFIGVSSHDENLDAQAKKLFTSKVVAKMREFEKGVKESREFQGGNGWITADLVPRKKVVDMKLVVDA